MAFNGSKMQNLPIIVVFPPGAGGRLIMLLLNYIVHNQSLLPPDSTGAAHNDSNTILENRDSLFLSKFIFCPGYYSRINPIVAAKIANDTHSDIMSCFLLLDSQFNALSDSDMLFDEIIKFIVDTNYMSATISRCHFVNYYVLRKVLATTHLAVATVIRITLNSNMDAHISSWLSNIKNRGDSPTPYQVNSKELTRSHPYFRLCSGPTMPEDIELPFSSIYNKDEDAVMDLIIKVCHKCSIPFSVGQQHKVMSYIRSYFAAQPVINLP